MVLLSKGLVEQFLHGNVALIYLILNAKSLFLYLLSVFYQVNDWAPRLANGDNATHGRLEIKYKGVWGTICDDGFGPEEGSVACKMLGNIF